MPKPPPISTRNPAFQSKLEPYREFIRECRAKRWSYPRIAAALREIHGLSAAPSTIFSFVKVRARRRTLYALPPPDDSVFQASSVNPKARDFFTPRNPRHPMKTNEDPTASEILHRLVVPIQTRGNLGKSTEAIARCEWMSQCGALWKGYDLDAFNRTFSTTYPEDVAFVDPGLEPEGELIKIFRCLTHSDVTVIDPSAHLNRTILRAMEMVRLTELCDPLRSRDRSDLSGG